MKQIREDRAIARRSQLLLLCIAALAIVLTLLGLRGIRLYAQTEFHEETAFRYIAQIGNVLDAQYKKDISPLASAALSDVAADALNYSFSKISKTDQTEYVAAQRLENPDTDSEHIWKQLLFAYTMDSPKIKDSYRKQLLSLSEADKHAYAAAVAGYLSGSEKSLPELAQSLVGSAEGQEANALLLQSIVLSGSQSPDNELVKNLKKSVRSAQSKMTAAKWASEGTMNHFTSFTVSFGKTLVLLACLLLINVLILLFNCLRTHDWFIDAKWLLILAIVDFLLVFQVLPMIYMLIKAFFPEDSFTLKTFERLYTYNLNLDAMKNTLIVSFFTMLFGTLIAFPLAWLIGRTDLYGKKFFRSLFVITYMVPPYVGAMAWLRLLNPNAGTLNVFLRGLLNLGTEIGPMNIYSTAGLIWVLTCFYYPYAFITISRAMEKMDPSLEEASKISGANPVLTVLKITLPMMLPSLIAGALLVFIGAASAYGIPSIIGAPGKIHTVTTRIVEYLGLGSTGLNDAIGMAVFLMLLSMLILYVSDVFIAKKQFITVSGKSTRPTIVELGRWRLPLTILVSLFSVLVIFIPFLTILETSFKFDLGRSVFAEGNFTFRQWQEIFTRTETLSALRNSIVYGFFAATIGIIVSVAMSYLLQRTQIRGRKIPDFLITLGSSTPSVVIALGLIMTMKGSFGVNIYNTSIIIVVAYLLKYVMMGMRTVVSSMSQIHPSLEECSQISGASWFRTMFKITGPLIFPSIAAGWFLIFIPCFYELSMTTLLYSNQTKTIGYQLYEYWTFHSQPQACAMAFGILLIVIALNFVLNKVTHGEFSI